MDPLINLFGQLDDISDDDNGNTDGTKGTIIGGKCVESLHKKVNDHDQGKCIGEHHKQGSSNSVKNRSNNRSSLVNNFRKASYKGPAKYLPPEPTEGNIEYKLKLINPSQSRFEHLVTQMKWRLREGHGEAIYRIGVEDKGLLVGLTEEEAECSLRTLFSMAEKLGAAVTILRERIVNQDQDTIRKVIEVLVRKVPDDRGSIELRVAVLGNVEVGKSTLLGVLTKGELDNGRGSARLNLFRHRHEIQTGHTSSISREILGFDSWGTPVTYNVCRTPEEIYESSSKLVTFIDLAGHQKYLRTTIFGLMGHSPHLTMLVVSAITGLDGTTREHLGLALALNLPVALIVNKIDLVPSETVKATLNQIELLLRSPACGKVPVRIKSKDCAITAASSIASNIVPIFTVSCLKGFGLKLLYTFLNVISPCLNTKDAENLMNDEAEFQIDETFYVPETGRVLGGLLVSGMMREGDQIQVGPLLDGGFASAKIHSIHRYKVPCRVVRAGQSATLALSNLSSEAEHQIRKGLVVLMPNSEEPRIHPICLYFQARMHVLYHATYISPGFQATIHIGNVCQTALVVAIMGKKRIVTNETASIMFRFLKHPEYIQPGCRVLFREGYSKCIGQVLQIFPLKS